jgi:hypothetical protein
MAHTFETLASLSYQQMHKQIRSLLSKLKDYMMIGVQTRDSYVSLFNSTK